ncbi:MAG: thioredoxin domain-containing protein [Bacteroidota bacterium]
MNKTNLLIHENSPYLRQHAHNPVNWHAWNEKTLAKAKELQKPLIISIGYSTCHWCHVMEKESFEDEQVAGLMNEHFICIKVDREERPEVDQVYMDAVQMITGAGGWPLNCFALPDGQPFYGGTYFRKEQWMDILQRIAELYKKDPAEVKKYAGELSRGLSSLERQLGNPNDHIRKDDIEMFLDKLKESSDDIKGGLKGAPKFPLPVVTNTELDAYELYNDESLYKHAKATLFSMAEGGIYDQIGGGFARYSTDENWKIPHFEKMLYDNAQLVAVYSRAYGMTSEPQFKKVVYETLQFLEETFESPHNGYYSALDADSEGIEGRFYVWTAEEMDQILGSYSPLIKDYYGIGNEGYWEGNKNVLIRVQNIDEFARKNNLSVTELHSLLEHAKKQLLKHREKRTSPELDDKIITSWNALMLNGFTKAYTAFGDTRFLKKAENLGAFLKEQMIDEEGYLHRIFKDEQPKINGFLDDYAFTASAFLELYQVTANESYLYHSKKIAENAVKIFYDKHSGFFYYSGKDEKLIQRKRDIHDNVMPSSNTIMMDVLHDLGLIFENHEWIDIADKALKSIIPDMYRSAVAFSGWGSLLLKKYKGVHIMAITGPEAKQKMKELNQKTPAHIIVAATEKKSQVPVFENRFDPQTTRIFVCNEKACLQPVTDTDEAIKLITN